jgi:hypothetical protein
MPVFCSEAVPKAKAAADRAAWMTRCSEHATSAFINQKLWRWQRLNKN